MSINIGTAPYVGTITLTEGSPLHVKFVFSTPISTTVLIHWPDINDGYDVEFPVVNGVQGVKRLVDKRGHTMKEFCGGLQFSPGACQEWTYP